MAARRDSRVPAAVSAAAAVADSVIESVASAARDEGVSPQVLQKLKDGWRDRYSELSGFSEEEAALTSNKAASLKRARSLDESDVSAASGSARLNMHDRDGTSSLSEIPDSSSTAAAGTAANDPANADSGGASDAQIAREEREARETATAAAAAAAVCVPGTSRFVSSGTLMGTYDKHVMINKDADRLTVHAQNAVLRGKSRDLVLGSVKCRFSLQLLRDIALTTEDDLKFFTQAPFDEAEAVRKRESRFRDLEAEFEMDMMMPVDPFEGLESSGRSSTLQGFSTDDPFAAVIAAAVALTATTGSSTAVTGTAGAAGAAGAGAGESSDELEDSFEALFTSAPKPASFAGSSTTSGTLAGTAVTGGARPDLQEFIAGTAADMRDSGIAANIMLNMHRTSSPSSSEHIYDAEAEQECNAEFIVEVASTADAGEDSDEGPFYTAVTAAIACCKTAAAAGGNEPSEHELTLSMLYALRFQQ
eukprot:21502-Heterococcus_DN1.PRE.1